MSKGYVDADGHIMEKAEELIKYLEEPWRSAEQVIPRRLLPTVMIFIRRESAAKAFLMRRLVLNTGSSLSTRQGSSLLFFIPPRGSLTGIG